MATSSQDLKLQLTTNTSVAQPQDQETSLSTDTSMDQSQEHEPMIRGERTNQSFVTRSRRHEDKECFTREKCITGCIPCIWHFFSILTCQYIRPVNSCIGTAFMILLIAFFALFAIMISIFPTSAFLAVWIECPYGIYNICFTVKHHDDTHIIVFKDTNHTTTEPSLINIENKIEVQDFLDLSKIAFLFSTTASGVSQVFFFWALWCLFIKHYNWPHNCTNSDPWKKFKSYFCCIRENDHDSTKPLDPFDDDIENEVFEPSSIYKVYMYKKNNDISFFERQDELTNTPLQGERLCHYIICFAIALILLIVTVSLFVVAQYADASKDVLTETNFKWESVAVASEIYSLFRSLVSCFIFSKLMYGIQRKCEELEMFVYFIDDHYTKSNDKTQEAYKFVENQFNANGSEYINTKIDEVKTKILEDKESLALKYLEERDKHFIKKAVATLNWLQLWFLFHWLLYIISTFMTMTVLIGAVTLHVKATVPHHEQGVEIHPVEIKFLFVYSLVQCFFLFYPCLRAASVTRTRQRVIREISEKAKDEYSNIPPGVLNDFINSMKRRRFNFRLRILCAQMPFNMNIAYLSIAFGFVGVVLSLITSVTG